MLKDAIVVLAVAVAAAAAATAAAAPAQQPQVNGYEVYGDVMPNRVGTPSRPLPVGLKVNYRATEASGLRPKPVKRYSIAIYGGRENTNLFPACPAEIINDDLDVKRCPKGSLIGTGTLNAVAGSTVNPQDVQIRCKVPVRIYNGGRERASIYMVTYQPACPVAINQAISARYVDAFGGKGRAMQFEVPYNLLHPIPGLSIAVMTMETNLPRKTRRVRGRTRGYFESTRPCSRGTRWGEIEFVTEDGDTARERYVKPC